MAITISGQNNNDKILASDGVLDSISGFNVVGVLTATTFEVNGKATTNHISIGNNIHLGNAGIITATTLLGNVTGNINHTSNLLLQINGSEKFRVGNSGQFGIGGANYGTAGQVFTSGGSGSAPTCSTINSDKITEGNNEAEVIDDGSNGYFKVTTEGGERVRVGPAGQIGIAGANYGTSGQVLTSGGASASVAWATLEGGKVRNYKHVVDSGYSASSWASFTQVASFSYTPLQSTSKIIVIASLNLLWENSNVSNARMKFGSNSYVQFDKVEKAASVSGWLSGNAISIFHLGTAGNTSSNAVILELQGTGSHTSYFNYSSGDSQFLLLEMAPEG